METPSRQSLFMSSAQLMNSSRLRRRSLQVSPDLNVHNFFSCGAAPLHHEMLIKYLRSTFTFKSRRRKMFSWWSQDNWVFYEWNRFSSLRASQKQTRFTFKIKLMIFFGAVGFFVRRRNCAQRSWSLTFLEAFLTFETLTRTFLPDHFEISSIYQLAINSTSSKTFFVQITEIEVFMPSALIANGKRQWTISRMNQRLNEFTRERTWVDRFMFQ